MIALKNEETIIIPKQFTYTWSLYFMIDEFNKGTKFRSYNLID